MYIIFILYFFVKVLLNKLFLIIKFKCYFLGMKVVSIVKKKLSIELMCKVV